MSDNQTIQQLIKQWEHSLVQAGYTHQTTLDLESNITEHLEELEHSNLPLANDLRDLYATLVSYYSLINNKKGPEND